MVYWHPNTLGPNTQSDTLRQIVNHPGCIRPGCVYWIQCICGGGGGGGEGGGGERRGSPGIYPWELLCNNNQSKHQPPVGAKPHL